MIITDILSNADSKMRVIKNLRKACTLELQKMNSFISNIDQNQAIYKSFFVHIYERKKEKGLNYIYNGLQLKPYIRINSCKIYPNSLVIQPMKHTLNKSSK